MTWELLQNLVFGSLLFSSLAHGNRLFFSQKKLISQLAALICPRSLLSNFLSLPLRSEGSNSRLPHEMKITCHLCGVYVMTEAIEIPVKLYKKLSHFFLTLYFCLSATLSVCFLSICLSVFMSCLSCLSVCLPVYLSTTLYISRSVFLSAV